jgi:hypothetical protein
MPTRTLTAGDYKAKAEECRKLAAQAREREHREALENMAKAWEQLAAATRKRDGGKP